MKWTVQQLTTSSGYLQTCPLKFTPGLNCIIGARGTCKSTIVETIRFVFNYEPSKIESMVKPSSSGVDANGPFTRAGLLSETLSGGTAKCTFAATDDPSSSKYVIERTIPSLSRVYRDGVQQIDDDALLHRIEIFSQGDLQSIAQRADRRLALIDRPNQKRVEELSRRLHDVTQQLQAVGPQVRHRLAELESRQAKVQSLEPTRRQLLEIQSSRPSLSPELEAERVAFNDRRRFFEELKVATQAYQRAISAANSFLLEEAALRGAATLAAGLQTDAASALASLFESALATFPQVKITVNQAAAVDATLTKVAEEFEAKNAKYYELRKDQESVNEALKVEESLRQAVSAMEAVAAELNDLR
jgi:chromosome segregation ATPase